MSGRRSRDKGARVERAIVHALKAAGFAAERVPLSGAVGGRYSGDIVMPLMGRDLCLEAKARADGFRELYGWLDQRDVLIVKTDRQEASSSCGCPWPSRSPRPPLQYLGKNGEVGSLKIQRLTISREPNDET